MVDLILDGLEGTLDICKIEYPARVGIDGTRDVNRDVIAVPVHPPALVTGGNIGKPVCCFDCELLENFHRASLRNAKKLMGLETQSPLWVIQAVPHRKIGVGRAAWPVHRLKKEMVK